MLISADSPCDLRIGTSGYDYPEWLGVLYPRGIGRKEFLGAYSEAYATLELNFSYYGMPRAENIRELMARTRKPIDFSIKANQALTHKIDPSTWQASVDEFARGIGPLREADRLCAVLLEFPFSFHYRDDERRYLDKVLKALAAFPLVVEFRSAQWFNARVIDGLKERRVGLCSVDVPRLEGLPPLSDLVTSDVAYVRFHGRNEAAWWNGDAGARYEYLYSKDELSAWIPRLEAMSTQAKKLRVYFNNHRRGDAVTNSKGLASLAAAARLL
jgi:uncharacterized protein YecE (DUF72 family)